MATRFAVGARVDGLYDGNSDDVWYPGHVQAAHDDDATFDVLYDDGEAEFHVRAQYLRVHRRGTICVGTRVFGRYADGDQWYPGKIQEVLDDGTFTIEYDDGEVEPSVATERIRESMEADVVVEVEVDAEGGRADHDQIPNGGDIATAGESEKTEEEQDDVAVVSVGRDAAEPEPLLVQPQDENNGDPKRMAKEEEEEGDKSPAATLQTTTTPPLEQINDVAVDNHAQSAVVQPRPHAQHDEASIRHAQEVHHHHHEEQQEHQQYEPPLHSEMAPTRRKSRPTSETTSTPPRAPPHHLDATADAHTVDEYASILLTLEQLESSVTDALTTKTLLSTLVKQMRAFPQATADLVHARSGEALLISILTRHHAHAVIQCYGFVLLRRLCFLCGKSTHYFLRNGIIELVTIAMRKFPEDAILQASACGALAVFTRVHAGLTALLENRVSHLVLATIIFHKSYSVHTRQVHYYACEVLLELCELGDKTTIEALCGDALRSGGGGSALSDLSPVSLLLFLLRQALSCDDKKACCAVGTLLMCLASCHRHAAQMVLDLNGLAELSTVMAKYPMEPGIQKYAASASKEIALCSMNQPSPSQRRAQHAAHQLLGESSSMEELQQQRLFQQQHKQAPNGSKSKAKASSSSSSSKRKAPSQHQQQQQQQYHHSGVSHLNGFPSPSHQQHLGAMTGNARDTLSFSKYTSPIGKAPHLPQNIRSFGNGSGSSSSGTAPSPSAAAYQHQVQYHQSPAFRNQVGSPLVILDGQGHPMAMDKKRQFVKEERHNLLFETYGVDADHSTATRTQGIKRRQLKTHIVAATVGNEGDMISWASPVKTVMLKDDKLLTSRSEKHGATTSKSTTAARKMVHSSGGMEPDETEELSPATLRRQQLQSKERSSTKRERDSDDRTPRSSSFQLNLENGGGTGSGNGGGSSNSGMMSPIVVSPKSGRSAGNGATKTSARTKKMAPTSRHAPPSSRLTGSDKTASTESLNSYATQLFKDEMSNDAAVAPANAAAISAAQERGRLSFADKLHKMIDKAKSSLAHGSTVSLATMDAESSPMKTAAKRPAPAKQTASVKKRQPPPPTVVATSSRVAPASSVATPNKDPIAKKPVAAVVAAAKPSPAPVKKTVLLAAATPTSKPATPKPITPAPSKATSRPTPATSKSSGSSSVKAKPTSASSSKAPASSAKSSVTADKSKAEKKSSKPVAAAATDGEMSAVPMESSVPVEEATPMSDSADGVSVAAQQSTPASELAIEELGSDIARAEDNEATPKEEDAEDAATVTSERSTEIVADAGDASTALENEPSAHPTTTTEEATGANESRPSGQEDKEVVGHEDAESATQVQTVGGVEETEDTAVVLTEATVLAEAAATAAAGSPSAADDLYADEYNDFDDLDGGDNNAPPTLDDDVSSTGRDVSFDALMNLTAQVTGVPEFSVAVASVVAVTDVAAEEPVAVTSEDQVAEEEVPSQASDVASVEENESQDADVTADDQDTATAEAVVDTVAEAVAVAVESTPTDEEGSHVEQQSDAVDVNEFTRSEHVEQSQGGEANDAETDTSESVAPTPPVEEHASSTSNEELTAAVVEDRKDPVFADDESAPPAEAAEISTQPEEERLASSAPDEDGERPATAPRTERPESRQTEMSYGEEDFEDMPEDTGDETLPETAEGESVQEPVDEGGDAMVFKVAHAEDAAPEQSAEELVVSEQPAEPAHTNEEPVAASAGREDRVDTAMEPPEGAQNDDGDAAPETTDQAAEEPCEAPEPDLQLTVDNTNDETTTTVAVAEDTAPADDETTQPVDDAPSKEEVGAEVPTPEAASVTVGEESLGSPTQVPSQPAEVDETLPDSGANGESSGDATGETEPVSSSDEIVSAPLEEKKPETPMEDEQQVMARDESDPNPAKEETSPVSDPEPVAAAQEQPEQLDSATDDHGSIVQQTEEPRVATPDIYSESEFAGDEEQPPATEEETVAAEEEEEQATKAENEQPNEVVSTDATSTMEESPAEKTQDEETRVEETIEEEAPVAKSGEEEKVDDPPVEQDATLDAQEEDPSHTDSVLDAATDDRTTSQQDSENISDVVSSPAEQSNETEAREETAVGDEPTDLLAERVSTPELYTQEDEFEGDASHADQVADVVPDEAVELPQKSMHHIDNAVAPSTEEIHPEETKEEEKAAEQPVERVATPDAYAQEDEFEDDGAPADSAVDVVSEPQSQQEPEPIDAAVPVDEQCESEPPVGDTVVESTVESAESVASDEQPTATLDEAAPDIVNDAEAIAERGEPVIAELLPPAEEASVTVSDNAAPVAVESAIDSEADAKVELVEPAGKPRPATPDAYGDAEFAADDEEMTEVAEPTVDDRSQTDSSIEVSQDGRGVEGGAAVEDAMLEPQEPSVAVEDEELPAEMAAPSSRAATPDAYGDDAGFEDEENAMSKTPPEVASNATVVMEPETPVEVTHTAEDVVSTEVDDAALPSETESSAPVETKEPPLEPVAVVRPATPEDQKPVYEDDATAANDEGDETTPPEDPVEPPMVTELHEPSPREAGEPVESPSSASMEVEEKTHVPTESSTALEDTVTQDADPADVSTTTATDSTAVQDDTVDVMKPSVEAEESPSLLSPQTAEQTSEPPVETPVDSPDDKGIPPAEETLSEPPSSERVETESNRHEEEEVVATDDTPVPETHQDLEAGSPTDLSPEDDSQRVEPEAAEVAAVSEPVATETTDDSDTNDVLGGKQESPPIVDEASVDGKPELLVEATATEEEESKQAVAGSEEAPAGTAPPESDSVEDEVHADVVKDDVPVEEAAEEVKPAEEDEATTAVTPTDHDPASVGDDTTTDEDATLLETAAAEEPAPATEPVAASATEEEPTVAVDSGEPLDEYAFDDDAPGDEAVAPVQVEELTPEPPVDTEVADPNDDDSKLEEAKTGAPPAALAVERASPLPSPPLTDDADYEDFDADETPVATEPTAVVAAAAAAPLSLQATEIHTQKEKEKEKEEDDPYADETDDYNDFDEEPTEELPGKVVPVAVSVPAVAAAPVPVAKHETEEEDVDEAYEAEEGFEDDEPVAKPTSPPRIAQPSTTASATVNTPSPKPPVSVAVEMALLSPSTPTAEEADTNEYDAEYDEFED